MPARGDRLPVPLVPWSVPAGGAHRADQGSRCHRCPHRPCRATRRGSCYPLGLPRLSRRGPPVDLVSTLVTCSKPVKCHAQQSPCDLGHTLPAGATHPRHGTARARHGKARQGIALAGVGQSHPGQHPTRGPARPPALPTPPPGGCTCGPMPRQGPPGYPSERRQTYTHDPQCFYIRIHIHIFIPLKMCTCWLLLWHAY